MNEREGHYWAGFFSASLLILGLAALVKFAAH